MARERLCKVCGGWHDLDEPWPSECYPRKRDMRTGPTPYIISDTMDGVQSQLDGKIYESKSALRKTYREAGVIELGNDAPVTPKPKPIPDRAAIETALKHAAQKTGLLD